MKKEIILTIKEYLENKGVISDAGNEVVLMNQRRDGKEFSLEEHIRGMVYSLMSAQTVWANIEKNKKNIDRIFKNYNPEWIKECTPDYFVVELGKIRCRSRLTNAQMKVLADNVKTMERIVLEYGSMDNFVTSDKTENIVEKLAMSNSPYKLKQMAEALVREYLRNVGIDTAKPDVHMKRIMGKDRLGVSINKEASNKEVLDEVSKLSRETGLWMSQIDYILWSYCATDFGEICTETPHCAKCVIREYCNHCK